MNRMKDYKFRVWNIKEKRFIHSDYFAIGLSGEIIQHQICYDENNENGYYDDSWNEELDVNNYIIQQFTGFLDKEDREIYEGDIVNYTVCNLFCGKITYRGVITWDLTDLSYKIFTYTDYKNNIIDKTLNISHNNIIEVVGNVYQNKELLENKG